MNAAPRIPPDACRRVWVERLRPAVDDGAHPIKRTVGEEVRVTADVFADGHDQLAVVLRWRAATDDAWHERPMEAEGNDRWAARFRIGSLAVHEYTVAAWIDAFASWRLALRKKLEAGQRQLHGELLEGAVLVRAAADRAGGSEAGWLAQAAAFLENEKQSVPQRAQRALATDLAAVVSRHPDRSQETVFAPTLRVDVNRERARFGAWYEFFPRSAGRGRGHGTFRDAEAWLPRVAAMGFDVVYLPPIHPIGEVNRKGRNNTLEARDGDPGSPWAIGNATGGHTDVHPDLGTLASFDRFVKAARAHGLEVALDIAFQCAPDHPWVTEHPTWFRHRPDGSIQYAENPPKKYQDIVPLDFESPDWEALWAALRDVILFWAGRGVRIFRVDNPHTKPFRFWEWAIHEVKQEHPDTIFLSEAFTRPKVMHALAKVGFDQSYTYFTWRNTKQELRAYLEELTQDTAEFFRPNFWPNTPDILPEHLQFGGRAAFLARVVLAATLTANYGIYSGYELCESQAIPGTEEYLDSEKYEIKERDFEAPGHIRDAIRRLNEIRRENPALQDNRRLVFHETDNDNLLAYSKSSVNGDDVVLVVVNVDPHHAHQGWVDLSLDALDVGESETFQAHDLLGEGRYLWSGRRNYVRLDPAQSPAQIFRIRRRTRTEHDFDYYL